MSALKPSKVMAFGATTALATATLMYCFTIGSPPSHADQKLPSVPQAEARQHANALSEAFRHATNRVQPAVVTIQRTAEMKKVAMQKDGKRGERRFEGQIPDELKQLDPFLRKFFEEMPDADSHGGPREMPHGRSQSSGSGVIIDKSGVVLTNNHVVEGGGKIIVRLTDGREFEATDVKTDPSTDLAIVRIKPSSDLPTAVLGDSDQTQVGDWVLALGQPFGLANSVTAGIISAKARGIGITEHEEFLQTDAAINPGNSGGPLVNLEGEVIGINTAISSTSGGYQGIGFAVPVNVVKWVSRQLNEDGTVHRAYLGIGIQAVTQEIATQLGMSRPRGALVTDVRSGSPAEKSGVKVGDVVTDYAGTQVNDPRELSAVVARTKIGSQQTLRVIRDGKEQNLTVHVQEMPQGFKVAKRLNGKSAVEEGTSIENLGLNVAPLTAEKAEQLGMKGSEGLLIMSVEEDSPAGKAGLATGMVIERVGQKNITTVDSLKDALKTHPLQRGVLFLVRSNQGSRFVVVKE